MVNNTADVRWSVAVRVKPQQPQYTHDRCENDKRDQEAGKDAREQLKPDNSKNEQPDRALPGRPTAVIHACSAG